MSDETSHSAPSFIPVMSGQRRYLLRMVGFLAVVAGVAAVLVSTLQMAFFANPALNGLILLVLIIGIFYSFRQVLRLGAECAWIENFRHSTGAAAADRILPEHAPPVLLAPVAAILGARGVKPALTPNLLRSLLDSIFARLDEARDISRYLAGLLIFLGLLGTFWGLINTLGAIGETIQGLTVQGGDIASVFEQLKSGLRAPLTGMGTAFSSSLFGLGGSLILGFLDLNAGQAQNQFFNELEEWLSSLTGVGGGPLAEGDAAAPVYVTALLEQTADSMERLQAIIARSEESRIAANNALLALSSQMAGINDQMQNDQELTRRLLDTQREMRAAMERLGQINEPVETGLDPASRQHLRNIDVHLARLLADSSDGRERTVNELRSDIRLLTRTVAALAQTPRREGG
ncbi:MAG: MotA/TolQ/ExbB proton channel family protein [Pseudomonadota bacterium]